MRHTPSLVLVLALLAGILPQQLVSQSVRPGDHGLFASRLTLERAAREARQVAADPDSKASLRRLKAFEASLLDRRLADGDFVAGDEIVLVVEGEPALTDTFTVRSGRVLVLPSLTDIELTSVLRSELEEHVTSAIARYVKEPRVQATPLVRLAVLGRVARPGFYALPADVPLAEAIMRAGGPAPDADLSRTEIRRSTEALWSAGEVRAAIAEGLTLDQLHLRAGDEIVIGERRRWNTQTMLQVLGAVTGVAALLLSFNG